MVSLVERNPLLTRTLETTPMKHRRLALLAGAAFVVGMVATIAVAHGQGMGQGIGPGWGPGWGMGYGMGPGMMMNPGQGWGQGHGMAPGMGQGMMGMMGMGPGMMGMGSPGCPGAYGDGGKALTKDDVTTMLERQLAWHGNDRLKVGKVEEKDDKSIAAEIVTKDNSLVDKFTIDRRTGWRTRVK